MITFLLAVISALLAVITGLLFSGGKWIKQTFERLEHKYDTLHDEFIVLKTEHRKNHEGTNF